VKFNTAIAKLMTFVNEAMKQEKLNVDSYLTFLKLLNPFAPHLAEELYTKVKNESLVFASYPKANPKLMEESQVTIVISINGKVRDKLEVSKGLDEESLKEILLKREKVQSHLNNMTIVKWIIIPDKLVNLVIKPNHLAIQ
jgi:leucyl-tRNA synthetase